MMRLPNAEGANIPIEKLTDYLLAEHHESGRSKAKFFRAHGFDETNVEALKSGLLVLAQMNEIAETRATAHGMIYAIDGELASVQGSVRVRTVWIVFTGHTNPRFVTAYPARKRRR